MGDSRPQRDVDLKAWLDGFAFHPADTRLKQLGHAIARQLVANMAGILHSMLPPGREKSLVFTHLELVLMYSNKALAVGGGPRELFDEGPAENLHDMGLLHASLVREGEVFGAFLEQDPRIGTYEAEQRGEGPQGITEPASSPLDTLPFPVPDVVREQAGTEPKPSQE